MILRHNPYSIDSVRKPLPKPDTTEARQSARLAEAIWLTALEHAAEYQLPEFGVLGALTLCLGRAAAAVCRSRQRDLGPLMDFLVRQLKLAAESDFRRPTFH